MTSLATILTRSHTEEEARESFARDVVVGLTASRKTLRPKYFYDEEGSRLFEEITQVPEYYPTRTEIGILEDKGAEIAQLIPAGGALVEFGAGSSVKIRIVLDALDKLAVYVPVDISGEFLAEQAEALQEDFPKLKVRPVAADFTRPFELPHEARNRPRIGFFPGSTIGNFDPPEAESFLRHAGRILGPGARMIVGVDLVKNRHVLRAAYNDADGVTAAFNLNLLRRINRELGGNFDLDGFEHRAVFDEGKSRIEMHLVSRSRQRVSICGKKIEFAAGETIHTECSYKYTIESFGELAVRSGWSSVESWTDKRDWFSVHVLALRDKAH
ncbi:MAG TPA: L-histidine N(alpha)-methyltransferase [Xanthobacteraceae bacterium]|nr:L-histidine N(alpha)-methyltransferase [Xanthobacteraceae bacterium]